MHDENKIKVRWIYMILGGLLAVALWVLGSPEVAFIQDLPFLAGAVAFATYYFSIILFVGLFDISLKAMFDYIDYYKVIREILTEGSIANKVEMMKAMGLFAIALAIVFVAAGLFFL